MLSFHSEAHQTQTAVAQHRRAAAVAWDPRAAAHSRPEGRQSPAAGAGQEAEEAVAAEATARA